MHHREAAPSKPSTKEAPKLDLKALPTHLRYVFLGREDTLRVIIAPDLNVEQMESLVVALKRIKKPLGGLLRTLLGSLPVFVPTMSNSCPTKTKY